MDLAAGVFFLRMIDDLVHVALHRPIAAGGVGIEPTTGSHRDVGRLLYRLHREIFGRLDDNSPLATDPRDDRGPVFVIVAPARLTFLAATSRSAAQRRLPALCRLALVAGRVTEFIRFDRPSNWRSIS